MFVFQSHTPCKFRDSNPISTKFYLSHIPLVRLYPLLQCLLYETRQLCSYSFSLHSSHWTIYFGPLSLLGHMATGLNFLWYQLAPLHCGSEWTKDLLHRICHNHVIFSERLPTCARCWCFPSLLVSILIPFFCSSLDLFGLLFVWTHMSHKMARRGGRCSTFSDVSLCAQSLGNFLPTRILARPDFFLVAPVPS